MGGACEKKQNKPNDTGAIAALDSAGASAGASGATTTGEVDTTPLAGIDISKLSADKTKVFYKLIGSLKSPCGKAHSLRVSVSSDTSCKRAPFAVRYVASLLEDEANETQTRDEYAKKYEKAPTMVKLDIARAPRSGTSNAPVQLVEFFDYECPHCQVFKAALDQVVGDRPGQVGVAYLMFPLSSHPLSRNAAQAAIAANQQGKFKEMHDKLFAESPRHSQENVFEYAKAIGLDMARFEKDYSAAAAQVSDDLKQGEDAGVEATPTLYFNNRKYEGPMYPKYLGMWVDEEIAVNR